MKKLFGGTLVLALASFAQTPSAPDTQSGQTTAKHAPKNKSRHGSKKNHASNGNKPGATQTKPVK
jgi:hypothetical protein